MRAVTRREFFRMGFGALTCAALDWQRHNFSSDAALGRVATLQLEVLQRPAPGSHRLGWLPLDTLVQIGNSSVDADGAVWSDVGTGYVRSSEIQPVKHLLNPITGDIMPGGEIGEITVPFSDVRTEPNNSGRLAYRLYYSATCWVYELVGSATGENYYKIYDERLGIHYFVHAADVRLIPDAELAPLSPGISSKRLVVNLGAQDLAAYEGTREVLHTRISAGRLYRTDPGNKVRSWTPLGQFLIDRKKPTRHMGAGDAAGGPGELPGVPWVSYFHWKGLSFHGTWWHNDYGHPRSSGCINMRPDEARWLYRWSMPFAILNAETSTGPGTTVEIVEV